MIIRNEAECFLVNEDDKSSAAHPILHIRTLKNQFILSSTSEQMWLPIRYIENPNKRKGYRMTEGNIIKLGRVILKVKHINLASEANPVSIDKGRVLETEIQQIEACRICLSDECFDSNPLISPCSCSGTMKYVHVLCLQEWLKNKVKTRYSNYATSYYWKDLSCELCKDSLPSFVEANGQSFELVSINYPDKPYVVLEDFRPERDQSYGIHIVALDNSNYITIGRAQENDIKINDISVSRKHAVIRNVKNSFVIDDLNSKFGSLLLLKGPIRLSKKNNVTIQLSRTLLSFRIKQRWSFRKCITCGSGTVVPEYSQATMGGNEDFCGLAQGGSSFREFSYNSIQMNSSEGNRENYIE